MSAGNLEEAKRVVVADPCPLLREGLIAAIERGGRFAVVAEAGNVAEASAAIEGHHPDVLTLCLELGPADGVEFVKQVRALQPGLRILVLSSLDEDTWAARAIGAGADGYISKNAPTSQVLEALDAVALGEPWLSPGMTSQVLRRVFGKEKPDVRAGALDILSDRELHVFHLMGTGLGTRQIAAALSLSVKTIETYPAHIREKLGLHNAAETVTCARAWVDHGGTPGAVTEQNPEAGPGG